MLADDIAAPQCGKADRALADAGRYGRRAQDRLVVEAGAAALGDGLAEHQRRAGGRVDLAVVVHLDDLDVPARPEHRGGLPAPARPGD